jgi:hypothetical protein
MEKRWPLELSSNDKEAWKRRVKDRWIMHSGSVSRGKLVRHGIARLWWVAHLTFDPKADSGIAKNDAYAYTREAFKSEDRINAIFDREVGAHPSVRRAILDHTAKLDIAATDKHLRNVMQYLTLVNGYREIGMLDLSLVHQLIETATQREASANYL